MATNGSPLEEGKHPSQDHAGCLWLATSERASAMDAQA